MITAYNETLYTLQLDYLEVEDIIEVEPVECSSTLNTFNSTVQVTLNATALNSTALAAVADEFRASYNTLSQRFCDPFFRTVSSASVVMERRRTNVVDGRKLSQLIATISYSGNCRGCVTDTTLFDEGTRRLGRLETGLARRRGRWLQGDSCFCASVNVQTGAPTERQFFQRFGQDIDRLSMRGGLSGVMGVDDFQEQGSNRAPPDTDQCTSADQCRERRQGVLCVASQCLFDGNPRMTLTWTGDDDYDLTVTTPLGVTVSADNGFDPLSGGVFNTKFVQTTFDSHVESIYFPRSGSAPSGIYSINVNVFAQRGTADTWTLQVFGNMGQLENSFTGSGASMGLTYSFGDGAPPPDEACVIGEDSAECCRDTDCTDFNIGDFCVARHCIQEGNPRFTLSYFGGKCF